MLTVFQRAIVGYQLKQTSSGSEHSSGSDDPEGRDNELQMFKEDTETFKSDMYAIIKIRDFVRDYYGDKKLAKEIRHFCQGLRKEDLTLAGNWEKISCEVQLFLETHDSLPSPEELREHIKNSCKEHSVYEWAKAESERAKAESEARKAAEERIKQLEMQLQQLQFGTGSQTPASSSVISPFFHSVSIDTDHEMKDIPTVTQKNSDHEDDMDLSDQESTKKTQNQNGSP